MAKRNPALVGTLLVLVATAALIVGLTAKQSIRAQESQALVTGSFPHTITFTHDELPPDTQTAEVFYTVHQQTCATVGGRGLATIDPQARIVTWHWDLTPSGGLPPGTPITYSWRFTDSSGNTTDTPQTTYTFEDQRFTWKETQSGHIRLRWHQGTDGFANALLDSIQDTLGLLQTQTGATLAQDVTIYLYSSTPELHDALIFPQEWTGGVAFQRYNTIAISIPPGRQDWGQRALAHEVTHIVLGQHIFNCYTRIPSWLDEGLATWAEGDLRDNYQEAMDAAIDEDRLFTMRGLRGSFPTHAEDALLAYGQSYAFVEHLLQAHGPDEMRALLDLLAEGTLDTRAVQTVYGADYAALHNQWRISIGLPPSATPTPAPTSTSAPLPTSTPKPTPAPTSTATPTHQTPTKIIPTPTRNPQNDTVSTPIPMGNHPNLGTQSAPKPTKTDISPTPRPNPGDCSLSRAHDTAFSLTAPLPLIFAGAILTWRRTRR